MKLRRCGTLHFINAIKGDSVRKLRNVDSRGKPAFVFKDLKDIYEAECATNLHVPSKSYMRDQHGNGVVNCPPMAERITSGREHTVNISDCNGTSDEILRDADDLLFEETTLKQIKKRCKAKKRKRSDLVFLSPKLELTDVQQVEDEDDLNTPLSRWRPKLLNNTKSKKCAKRNISATLEHYFPIKTEEILITEDSKQLTIDNCAPMAKKVEVSPANYSECEVMSSAVEVPDVSCISIEPINSAIEATDGSSISNEQVNFSGTDSTKLLQTCDTALENKETILLAGYETCVVNEVSYGHLDDFDPNSFLPSSQETGQHFSHSSVSEADEEADIKHSPPTQCFPLIDRPVDDKGLVVSSQSSDMQEISGNETAHEVADVPLDNGLCCTDFVHGSKVGIIEDNATESLEMFSSSQSRLNTPEMPSNDFGYLVSDQATNDNLSCTEVEGSKLFMFEDITTSNLPHNLINSSTRSPCNNYISSWSCYPYSASGSDLVALESDSPTSEDEKSLMANISSTTGNCSTPNNHLTALEGAYSVNEEKQLLISVDTEAKTSPSSNVNEFLKPEINDHDDVEGWQPPERFPSTRKAISPICQKKLCLAMNSKELNDDIESYECNGKLFTGNENENENNDLTAGSDSAGVKSLMIGEVTGMVTGAKAILSPKRILKKPNYNNKVSPPRKGSPPKGRLEGPHVTRSVPGLSTGRTSIENCHESAIAFSQRQMQDIESIAVKLMTELKSMKDIVEEKLLYEAYHCTSLKSNVDEVKTAIKSATKAEETTKKWLSMMARDCNRFCKIMSQPQRLTEEGSAATENIIHKEKKKISFADEAGGELCQVKFFETVKFNTEFNS